jgi:hypothetical protein
VPSVRWLGETKVTCEPAMTDDRPFRRSGSRARDGRTPKRQPVEKKIRYNFAQALIFLAKLAQLDGGSWPAPVPPLTPAIERPSSNGKISADLRRRRARIQLAKSLRYLDVIESALSDRHRPPDRCLHFPTLQKE